MSALIIIGIVIIILLILLLLMGGGVIETLEQLKKMIRRKGHDENDPEVKDILNSIKIKIDQIMTKQEKFDAALERLNTTTNDIAADLTLLKKQIQDGTVSDESLAKLDTNVATLEALGASTDNPVPENPAPGEGQ
jgi:hypothetical protein